MRDNICIYINIIEPKDQITFPIGHEIIHVSDQVKQWGKKYSTKINSIIDGFDNIFHMQNHEQMLSKLNIKQKKLYGKHLDNILLHSDNYDYDVSNMEHLIEKEIHKQNEHVKDMNNSKNNKMEMDECENENEDEKMIDDDDETMIDDDDGNDDKIMHDINNILSQKTNINHDDIIIESLKQQPIKKKKLHHGPSKGYQMIQQWDDIKQNYVLRKATSEECVLLKEGKLNKWINKNQWMESRNQNKVKKPSLSKRKKQQKQQNKKDDDDEEEEYEPPKKKTTN